VSLGKSNIKKNTIKFRKKHHLLIILALTDLAVEKENFFVGGK
jgi:hypothetical protein